MKRFRKKPEKPTAWLRTQDAPAQAHENITPEMMTVEYLRTELPYTRGDFRTLPKDKVARLLVKFPLFEYERPDGTPEDPSDKGEKLYKGDLPLARVVTPDYVQQVLQEREASKRQAAETAKQEQVTVLFLRAWQSPWSRRGYQCGDLAGFSPEEANLICSQKSDYVVEGVTLKDCKFARPATQDDFNTTERKRVEKIRAQLFVDAMRIKEAGGK